MKENLYLSGSPLYGETVPFVLLIKKLIHGETVPLFFIMFL